MGTKNLKAAKLTLSLVSEAFFAQTQLNSFNSVPIAAAILFSVRSVGDSRRSVSNCGPGILVERGWQPENDEDAQ